MKLSFWRGHNRNLAESQASADSGNSPLLIVGLGNPGAQYEHTWHNFGFLTLDHLAQETNIAVRRLKHRSLIGEGRIGKRKVILQKPQTYMNESGVAVAEAMRYYKISVANVIVIVDDLDLEIGRCRLRASGSSGTHNGMRSLASRLNSTDFARLRLGIGPKPSHNDLADYVLSQIPKVVQPEVAEQIEKATRILVAVANDGVEATQSRLQEL